VTDFEMTHVSCILSFKTAATIPEGLIALGSAAIGAWAVLLAPSPMTR